MVSDVCCTPICLSIQRHADLERRSRSRRSKGKEVDRSGGAARKRRGRSSTSRPRRSTVNPPLLTAAEAAVHVDLDMANHQITESWALAVRGPPFLSTASLTSSSSLFAVCSALNTSKAAGSTSPTAPLVPAAPRTSAPARSRPSNVSPRRLRRGCCASGCGAGNTTLTLGRTCRHGSRRA